MGRKKALIIAVSEYDKDYPLKYCEKDGIDVYNLLSSPQLGYEIEKKNKLIGRVKSEEMKDAIVDFFQNEEVKPDDMLLFYYSGHGIREGVNTYLSPSEINPKLPIKRGFSFKDLRTVIEDPGSVSGTKVVILDCCHSGGIEIGKGQIDDPMQLIMSIKEDSEALEQGEGICILAASQAYQGAYPLEEQGHSIFTYYLLEGLRDNEESVDSNGNVTPYSLNRYISKKINSLPVEKRPRQKPLMRSETSGEIILASYPKKSPASPHLIMPIPSNPFTKSSEAEVHKGILRSKTKISIAVGIAAVVAVVITLALFNQDQQMLSSNKFALYDKGTALAHLGKYSTAIPYLDKALAIDSNFKEALTAKGLALDGLGNYKEAIIYLDKALAIDPSDESALDNKGWALNGLGNYKEAIIYLDKALAIDPKNKYVLYKKGVALDALGNHTGAIGYYDKALAIDPYYKNALNGKSSALNYIQKAALINEQKLTSEKYALYKKGQALYTKGNYTEALTYVDKALAIDPNYYYALTGKGFVLDALGNHTGAIGYYDKALAIDPYYKNALTGKGWALISLGNNTGAITYFDKALAKDPKYEDALLGLAQANRLHQLTQPAHSNATLRDDGSGT